MVACGKACLETSLKIEAWEKVMIELDGKSIAMESQNRRSKMLVENPCGQKTVQLSTGGGNRIARSFEVGLGDCLPWWGAATRRESDPCIDWLVNAQAGVLYGDPAGQPNTAKFK